VGNAYDPVTPLEETLAFLDDAVRAGKVDYVGLSNFIGWQLQRAVDLAAFRGLAQPVTLQPQYNLLVREIEWEIVPACRANGLGLLPWSPLGGGWLTGKHRRNERATGNSRLEETARLDTASDPGAADYPYGGLGIEQQSRSLG
jgi:aryl-alcohol dehydrogenase-like predicted oxidoreductase